mmetsp:Transcript_6203/g.14130  ORF Transcript_6203/g.14130 Transcript_6203/m.14130 type:complete len:255 (+) Transcript_6203:1893-2657(+)
MKIGRPRLRPSRSFPLLHRCGTPLGMRKGLSVHCSLLPWPSQRASPPSAPPALRCLRFSSKPWTLCRHGSGRKAASWHTSWSSTTSSPILCGTSFPLRRQARALSQPLRCRRRSGRHRHPARLVPHLRVCRLLPRRLRLFNTGPSPCWTNSFCSTDATSCNHLGLALWRTTRPSILSSCELCLGAWSSRCCIAPPTSSGSCDAWPYKFCRRWRRLCSGSTSPCLRSCGTPGCQLQSRPRTHREPTWRCSLSRLC